MQDSSLLMIEDSWEWWVSWVSGIDESEGEGLMSISIYRRFSSGKERWRSSKYKNENDDDEVSESTSWIRDDKFEIFHENRINF